MSSSDGHHMPFSGVLTANSRTSWITRNVLAMTGRLKQLGFMPDNKRLDEMTARGSVESLRSEVLHCSRAEAMAGSVFIMPSAIAVEKSSAEADSASSASSLRSPGSAVTTYHTGLSQY